MRLGSKLGQLALALVVAGGVAACGDDDPATPLVAPGDVQATVAGNNATVTWTAVSGAGEYVVQRQNLTRNGQFTTMGTTAQTTFSDTITAGNQYAYIVFARRGGDQSGASLPAILTVGAREARIGGTLTANRTLRADSVYILSGTVAVDSGFTLTIEPGTRIVGDTTAKPSALVIRRGAFIVANGTAQAPIVFTSQKAVGQRRRGDWGGVVINGRSNCNFLAPGAAASAVCNSEGFSAGSYGRNPALAEDSSGVLRYVRIEYAGYEFAPNNEINGLTLNGVGSRTRIEFVQVHRGADDGIEWFGGTVNVKHAVVTGADDDHFDYSTGWTGRGQFWIAQFDPTAGDKGFEVDNNETNFTAAPLTKPMIYNVTLVGRSGAGTATTSQGGLHLRRGTGGELYNAIVAGFNVGLDIDNAETSANCANGQLRVANTIFFGNAVENDGDADTMEADCRAAANWSITVATANPLNAGATSLTAPNFVPVSAAAVSGHRTVPTGDAFFSAVDYIGAVAPTGTPWYQGWITTEQS